MHTDQYTRKTTQGATATRSSTSMAFALLVLYTGISGVTSCLCISPQVWDEYREEDTRLVQAFAIIEWRIQWNNIVPEDNNSSGYYHNQGQAHIHDVYAPHRVATLADKRRLIPGVALDLTA